MAPLPPMRRLAAAIAVGILAVVVVVAPAHAETIRLMQWHLDSLQISKVHAITRGEGVIVGVVDSVGVDNTHSDLAGQILPGAGFGPGAASNGWSISAEAEHATGMAGVIAAKGGGANSALGIAPAAKILPIGTSPDASRTEAQIAQGIRYAADHGAKVVNISLSGPDAPELNAAVRYALDHDVVVVAGAGNVDAGGPKVHAPADIPGVVAVSGTDRNAGFWSNSASGPEVVISAPATDIVSTGTKAAATTGYRSGTGTSDSSAIVSGAVALIRAKYPKLNAANVINRLLVTAKDQGPSGRDDQYGYGTVHILNALTKDVPEVAVNPLAPSGVPTSAAASTGTSSDEEARDEAAQARIRLIAAVVGGTLLLALVLAVGFTRRRRRAQPAAQPYPYPPPGFYPPGAPPAPPPPPTGQFQSPPTGSPHPLAGGGFPYPLPEPPPPGRPGVDPWGRPSTPS